MKKKLIALLLLAAPMLAMAQSAKVVVDRYGNYVGTYIGESSTKYHVFVQDDGWVAKAGHSVRQYKAINGDGYLYPTCKGSINVRKMPTTNSAIVASWKIYEGEINDSYKCLGKTSNWYKVRTTSGKIGYVRQDLVEWIPSPY